MTTEAPQIESDLSAQGEVFEPVGEILASPDYRPVRLDDVARVLGFRVADYTGRLAMEGAVRRWLDAQGTPAYRVAKHWIVPLGRLRETLRRLADASESA